jgi:DNA polymerase III alpha subunit
MERELKEAAKLRRWNDDQINALLALLQEHAGYLYVHGHALALANHVLHQAWRKLDPATAPSFFAEVLNNGGSAHYGLGAAVEEARQWGVLLLPPCINRSSDRYVVVDPDSLDGLSSSRPAGAIRVPLTAIRGLGASTVHQILQMRSVFWTVYQPPRLPASHGIQSGQPLRARGPDPPSPFYSPARLTTTDWGPDTTLTTTRCMRKTP